MKTIPRWSTEEEIGWIKQVWLTGKKPLLIGYREGMKRRTDWGTIDREQVERELDKILGKRKEATG